MGPNATDRLDVLLAEYGRIRDEIFNHKSTQQTIVNFIILLVGAEFALFTQIADGETSKYVTLWLLLPLPFALLSIYHTGYTIRIHHLANYLDGDLRGKLESIVGEGTLRTRSYRPTRYFWALPQAKLDGKLTYIALMGLKGLPQAVPIAVCIGIGIGSLAWWQAAWLAGNGALLLTTTLIQHD